MGRLPHRAVGRVAAGVSDVYARAHDRRFRQALHGQEPCFRSRRSRRCSQAKNLGGWPGASSSRTLMRRRWDKRRQCVPAGAVRSPAPAVLHRSARRSESAAAMGQACRRRKWRAEIVGRPAAPLQGCWSTPEQRPLEQIAARRQGARPLRATNERALRVLHRRVPRPVGCRPVRQHAIESRRACGSVAFPGGPGRRHAAPASAPRREGSGHSARRSIPKSHLAPPEFSPGRH